MSMPQKNSIVDLEITDINADAFGVGRYNGVAVFVPGAAVGDKMRVKIVKVLSGYCFAVILEILQASEDRIEIDCPVFDKCGGCSMRHITYDSECLIKNNRVEQNLRRIGKFDITLPPIVKSPLVDGYRNKAQYPVVREGDEVKIGFYAARSHRVVSSTDCLIQPKIFSEINQAIKEFIIKYNVPVYDEESGRGLIRHIYLRQGGESKKIMLCVVVNGVSIPHSGQFVTMIRNTFEDVSSIILNVNRANTNVVLGKDNILLYGEETISDTLCGINVTLSPLTFYQVNRDAAELVYGIAREYADLKPDDTLLDLYCGAGTIGLSMAADVKEVIGIESAPPAVENARLNAKKNNIENARYIVGDAGSAAKELADAGTAINTIILDPPRKGCDDATISAIGAIFPERIVYISCNSATLARDCEKLSSAYGYSIVKAQAADMFPRTGHVECVVLMTREPSPSAL